jgi:hypothetical protein
MAIHFSQPLRRHGHPLQRTLMRGAGDLATLEV